MVSFQCDGCGDIVKKPKLASHRCYSTFTCIDCSTTFQGRSWDAHKSCMTEDQKYQKHIYQNKGDSKKKAKKDVELSEWSSTELGKDESKNLELALKHALKDGKAVCLRDIRKTTIELIEKHPKYKKSENLKKAFDKNFKLTLENNTIKFA
ncbi:hypothetical protein G6F56_000844 [Rhizopus delemar]|nr:hypothetical protein G6F56_000844 [Rhizopus delemar]